MGNVFGGIISKKIIISLAVTVVIGGVGVGYVMLTGGAKDIKVVEQLDIGSSYLEDHNFEAAKSAYEKAIEIDSDNSDAYVGLANAYIALGEYDAAIEKLKEAYKVTNSEVISLKIKEVDGLVKEIMQEKQNEEEKITEEQSVEDAEEESQVIEDENVHKYKYTYTFEDGSQEIIIITVNGTPTEGNRIEMSGMGLSSAYANVSENGSYDPAETIDGPDSSYTVVGNPAKVYAWIDPWVTARGGGMVDVIRWEADGSVNAWYSPDRLVQLQ